MAAIGVEEDQVAEAARILVNLRYRRLLRWPEWVPKEPEPEPEPEPVEADVFCPPLERWPKRQRNGNRARRNSWSSALWWALPPKQHEPSASASAGYGAGEEREREPSPAPPRWRERSRSGAGPVRDQRSSGSPAYYSAPSGSGPSTSADRKARSRRGVEANKAASPPGPVGAAPPEEPDMKADSPKTPLDFRAAGAGSGASSSGDDAARKPAAKRRALGSASSGDEGCSSPDKRVRVDAGDVDRGREKQQAISEPKAQTTADSDKGGVVKFEFDLNMPCPEEDEEFPPGF